MSWKSRIGWLELMPWRELILVRMILRLIWRTRVSRCDFWPNTQVVVAITRSAWRKVVSKMENHRRWHLHLSIPKYNTTIHHQCFTPSPLPYCWVSISTQEKPSSSERFISSSSLRQRIQSSVFFNIILTVSRRTKAAVARIWTGSIGQRLPKRSTWCWCVW